MRPAPILAIPPFPGAKRLRFARWIGKCDDAGEDPDTLLDALASSRVGGCYWGRQKALPGSAYVLDGTGEPGTDSVLWSADDDPWHLLKGAEFARLPESDPRALLVLAAGVPLVLVSEEGTVRDACSHDKERLTFTFLSGWQFQSPFNGSELTILGAIDLCGMWRTLIDANRRIYSVMGIAHWKKPTVTALLWSGGPVPYNRKLADLPPGAAVALWRTRVSRAQARALEKAAPPVIEIEDGFIRSAGLGADCVPPLSIIVDDEGPHFVPDKPSGIERLLQGGDFPAELLSRARSLREAIIAGGLSKYERGQSAAVPRPGGARKHVLVPGQVEDDRAVTSGGALSSNLELLRRARAEAGPDAYLIYKPHPDVLAGHRRGLIAERDMAALADQVEMAAPMAALIAMVDELHVNSSLAGFEALLRGKKVIVHGVPFYAGWGLTIDRGSVPTRRTARRNLDDLVAAALLLYPRYLDPVTGLPCSAEVLIRRLNSGPMELRPFARLLVAFRRFSGMIRRLLRMVAS